VAINQSFLKCPIKALQYFSDFYFKPTKISYFVFGDGHPHCLSPTAFLPPSALEVFSARRKYPRAPAERVYRTSRSLSKPLPFPARTSTARTCVKNSDDNASKNLIMLARNV
jgi:hypothetical protein